MEILKNLFGKSNKWDQHKLVSEIRKWQDSKSLPLESSLPSSFYLSTEFWDSAKRIYTFTYKDKKEHAISLWSIYKQIVVTDVTRGSASKVTTQDRIQVKFDPIKGKQEYTMRVMVNGEQKERRTVKVSDIKKVQQNKELRFLFNIHTHPPHNIEGMLLQNEYSYFSQTDLNTLLTGSAPAIGLITDKVIFVFKTRNTPKEHGLGENEHPTREYNRDVLKLVEYEADFVKKLFVRKV